ncbi:hypothetical protein [uncultured Eubacterium sp.]|uniref:hypothetical protein n=1 Tax=uncultured Eubacterium sp. TaxID=165185 RepID=UPI0025DE7041|nr:hypothetical protein [uncultured Eubacterium sp.]
MKRILLLLLCVGVMFGAFSACAKSGGEDCTAVSDGTEVSTDEAQIKDNKAIDLVKAFSNEKLGLDDETADKCSFLVQKNGEVIDGENYVKVIAAEKKETDDGTYTFDIKGEYYISFDGNTVLKKVNDNYEKLER